MNSNSTRLIRIKEVTHKVGIAKSTVWHMVKEGKFPKPKKLSPRVTVWMEAKVDEFIQSISKG
jgi:prophage regulatory protein